MARSPPIALLAGAAGASLLGAASLSALAFGAGFFFTRGADYARGGARRELG